MIADLRLTGGRLLRDGRLEPGEITLAGGRLADDPGGAAQVDLCGYLILPGIVDAHGDGFERHLAPRRGAMTDIAHGFAATEAELAASGLTTAMLAQFWSWEGGLRSPDMARRFLDGLEAYCPAGTDMRVQLRIETHMIDDFPEITDRIARHRIGYVVFNDHLPHQRLAEGRRPPRLTGTALKSGRSPEAHLVLMQALSARSAEVPGAVGALAAALAGQGVLLGSHDDATAQARGTWQGRGAAIAEFPETREAAQAAHDLGGRVVLGAPNVMRGASHMGNVRAADLVAEGLCDALASDYHYPSPLHAAFRLADDGVADFAAAWELVSEGPARMLGLTDRGRIEDGLRADLVVVDPDNRRAVATIAGGRITHMSGDVAARFVARRG